jgi:hypothetical protein
MIESQAQIDTIVREVLRRMAEVPSLGANGTASGAVLADSTPISGSSSVLELASKVITLAELAGRLEGVKSVRVPRRAVITPAAADVLRQREIDVQKAGETPGVQPSSVPLVVGVAQSDFDPAGLLRDLMRQGVESQRLAKTGLLDVIDELTELVVRGGCLGLLLTDDSAAALCLANRVAGVRAALAVDGTGLGRAIRSIGLNLLVIEVAGRSPFQLRQLVIEFCRGPYACPAEIRQRLG